LRSLPNLLTMLRVLLIPWFLWLVFVSTHPGAIQTALFVFAAASITDWLDGYLARKWNVISDFGKIMDPLADKLLVLSALAGITWRLPFRLSMLIFSIILVREIVITILREVYKRRGIIVPADKLGKIKTVMQMTGLVAAYALWAWMAEISPLARSLVNIWFWLVAAITVVSGANYLMAKAPGAKK